MRCVIFSAACKGYEYDTTRSWRNVFECGVGLPCSRSNFREKNPFAILHILPGYAQYVFFQSADYEVIHPHDFYRTAIPLYFTNESHCDGWTSSLFSSSDWKTATTFGEHNICYFFSDTVLICILCPMSVSVLDWTERLRENCVTFQGRVVISADCVDERTCHLHGWTPIGSACHVTPAIPDVFLLSCVLFCGTFAVAYFLRTFRTTRYFPTQVQRIFKY